MGRAGIFHTLKLMRNLVNDFKSRLEMIQLATRLVGFVAPKDELGEVNELFLFVRDKVRYIRDVLHVETLATPTVTLARRAGDCDDKTTLLATLCESIGYPTHFVVAGYTDPKTFEHVYLQIFAAEQWINADPTEYKPLGWAPPNPTILELERI